MLDARTCKSINFPFTTTQWQELERQAIVFRYLVSGVPVPPHLISTVLSTPLSSPSYSSSGLFPQQQPLPIGWGCFQVGFGRKVDPEPGRCRRTDGKKWRCSKEAFPDSKYCEKHMHRGKSKAKKQFEAFNTSNSNTKSAANAISPIIPPTMNTCFSSPSISCPVSSSRTTNYAHKSPSNSYQTTPFYPFLCPGSSSTSKQSSDFTLSTQNENAPLCLMDPELYYGQPNKHTTFSSASNYRS